MRAIGLIAGVAVLATTALANAGLISGENAKNGYGYDWYPAYSRIGNAQRDGVVDLYPSSWSIRPGERLALRVRSTSTYRLRVFRLGWYGGDGSRTYFDQSGFASDPQPYVRADSTYGRSEARWHDSLTVPTSSLPPGVYVARAETTTGKRALTFFVVRDDALSVKQPILVVVATATHQAYNPWPGAKRGGMSLYDFNSSGAIPTEGDGIPEAVKVSNDRPFYDGAGSADLANYETPAIRYLEKRGWEVAYCTDEDLHTRPEVMNGRRAILFVGHSEYWSRGRFDNVQAARDRGIHLMFATGDTLSWQIRYESGPQGPTSTVVGYKSAYREDPEQVAGRREEAAGNIAAARVHYGLVTRAWRSLELDSAKGIDERRPGITLTGVQSAAQIKHDYPWGHWSIKKPDHWLFKDTGVVSGSSIRNVMGYEIDSAKTTDSTYDRFRPSGQVLLGSIIDAADGHGKGSNAYYRAASGAEVVSFGATNFTWALDNYASGTTSVDTRVQKMVDNALARWTGTSPTTTLAMEYTPEPARRYEEDDPVPAEGPLFLHDVPRIEDEAHDPDVARPDAATDEGGCTIGHTSTRSGAAVIALVVAAMLARRRR